MTIYLPSSNHQPPTMANVTKTTKNVWMSFWRHDGTRSIHFIVKSFMVDWKSLKKRFRGKISFSNQLKFTADQKRVICDYIERFDRIDQFAKLFYDWWCRKFFMNSDSGFWRIFFFFFSISEKWAKRFISQHFQHFKMFIWSSRNEKKKDLEKFRNCTKNWKSWKIKSVGCG